MANKKALLASKYVVYAVLIFMLYILQTTPGFLQVMGVKPMLVVPATICIAMYEGEFVGGLLGAFAGSLCDLGAHTFYGFHLITLYLFCIGVGLAIIYFMKNTYKNAVLLSAGYLLTLTLMEILFYYSMWGYEGWVGLFLGTMIPRWIFSVIMTIPLYFLVDYLFAWYRVKLDT